jgi:hypothetical protein
MAKMKGDGNSGKKRCHGGKSAGDHFPEKKKPDQSARGWPKGPGNSE